MFHLCFHYTGLLGIGTVCSLSARLSTTASLLGSVSHAESMELALAQEAAHWPSFGIVLAKQKVAAVGECSDGLLPLVVAQIERGSPADKCGVLQPGDRLLCINDWHTAEGSLEEAQHLLRALSLSGNHCVTLLVEFNVIEPVLPPGPGSLFVVRLAKRGNCLGIVCRSERKGATKGEPLVISHIRVGSVAHRCGSIQLGDRVHSIDDIPLDACTVEEAMRLLQRSAQVVKLCIAKGGGQEQDLLDSAPPAIVYTLELARKGQPLGITIASAGGILDPIVISQLAPGGLAERTGALHVGDQILAVNGESLEGKKVGQITQLLQQCPDPVSLKLCRQMATPNRSEAAIWHPPLGSIEENNGCGNGIAIPAVEAGHKNGTPMKSVDSAMDSLEDSPPDGGQPLRYGTVRSAQLRPSASNNFQQADLISGASSDPYNGGTGWDSGLSSAAPTESQGGSQPNSKAAPDKCCGCQLGSGPSCSNSPHSSGASSSTSGYRKEEREKEDWVRILEALETVGEEEMLRKLEESILSGQASNYVAPGGGGPRIGHGQLLPSECGVLSRRFVQGGSANYAPISTPFAAPRPSLMKRPVLSPGQTRKRDVSAQQSAEGCLASPGTAPPECASNSQPGTPTPRRGGLSQQQSGELPPPMPSPRAPSVPAAFPALSSTFVPPTERSGSNNSIPFITSPTADCEEDKFDELSEVFSVQLNRCPLTKSFGFSVCDGPIEEKAERGEDGAEAMKSSQQQQQGIYIRSVVRDGPADRCGRVKPGDRILQINGRSIQFLTCDLALPLLATEKVDLLLLRRRTQQKRPVPV